MKVACDKTRKWQMLHYEYSWPIDDSCGCAETCARNRASQRIAVLVEKLRQKGIQMMNGKNFTNTLSEQESEISWMNISASMEKSASIAPRTNLLEWLRPRDISKKICGEPTTRSDEYRYNFARQVLPWDWAGKDLKRTKISGMFERS